MRVLNLLGRDDRGVVGVLVAVLVGGGMLLGMGALVIDVGQLYQNRAELQNGADAAALAVARSCAVGTCAPGMAGQFATANASRLTGGAAGVDLVCGSGTLGSCPASTGAVTDCPPPPPAGANYVDVHTSTRTPAGSTLLPPVFARALLGRSGYQGSQVKACAQVEWGAPLAANSIAVTISACTWDQATSLGSVFGPSPPYPPNPLPSPSVDQVLHLHTASSATGCPTEPAGADAPGNFGWTNDQTGTCQVFINGTTYGGNTGTSVSSACKTAISNAQANRALIFLPVYTVAVGTGAGTTYTLKGFAAFVITGYHITGSFSASDWLNPANDCKGSTFCLNGYFTQGLIPATGPLGGPNLGAVIAQLSG
jgi:hypothetical protein